MFIQVIGNTFIEGKAHENNLYEVKIGSDKGCIDQKYKQIL